MREILCFLKISFTYMQEIPLSFLPQKRELFRQKKLTNSTQNQIFDRMPYGIHRRN